jgi:uncharacterized protein with ParB-like and HNH nuclease domain
MSIAKSQTERIRSIFTGNKFVIPTYQRKYSWTATERTALWRDIEESINTDMSHFIGTLSFKENKKPTLSVHTEYEIIDGQQRITTLFILLSVLIDKIPDQQERESQRTVFIGTPNNLLLQPLGSDGEFLSEIIFNYEEVDISTITKRSQRFMYQGKKDFVALVSALTPEQVIEWIFFIMQKIEILVFNVSDQAQAVKMFSIINDRGLPLRVLDKTKSILMLYSTLFLNEELNSTINDCFEKIFDSYDDILVWKDELGILPRLEENTIFTQHYFSSKSLFPDLWDYRHSADTIFVNIKRKCETLKDRGDDLKSFIEAYVNDLSLFATSYAALIKEISTKDLYRKPFQYLGFTATLYPLIIRLYISGQLDELLLLLEASEVRVFKLTGTTAIKDIYTLSSNVVSDNLNLDTIKQRLINFNERFMNDFNFKNYLSNDIFRNSAVKYILSEYAMNNMTVESYNALQVEHIFSGDPNFEPHSYGFDEGYDFEKDRIGNLALLEENLNKGLGNAAPIQKVNGYLKSAVNETRNLAGEIQAGNFAKDNVDRRREFIIDFCLKRFGLTQTIPTPAA